ncbi:unnamed protein product [Hymenolepis diminuta]|uniref:Protein kinase domain-containing protein n=2 Tax=Hymenolepis diminuta TaxID=6216 RepID=A0A564YJM6_HYMDI|nr:unnamed protein product [Hymenolepis diminuta]
MDLVINKLRTTVSSALPGNPVSREFDLENQVGSSGPGLLWKLYAATKKSSKEPATVWIFEKKLVDRFCKRERELIIEKLKQGVANLTRLRHPRILSVVHPLEDSRESLGFATEPIFTSLANALGRTTNLTGPQLDRLNNFTFTETELKYGVIQICEALTFVHRDGKRFHLNVSPESIVVNRLGSWKLCGFEFACDGNEVEWVNTPPWQSSIPSLCQPNLDYCAPEVVIEGKGYALSDMFSVGMLLYTLYNHGISALDCHESYGAYREAVKKLKPLSPAKLSNIPAGIKDYVKMLLQPDVDVRPDSHELLKVPFFDDANVACLKSLDDLYQMDNLSRSKFYRNLPNAIKNLPPRINLHRVFPQLSEEFSNKNMVPFVLPSILLIIDMSSRADVTTYILPRFKPVLAINEPIQVVQVLLQNLGILVAKLSPSDFKTYALPILNSALDSNVTPILELCLRSLPDVAQLMDFSILKSNILPRLKKVYARVDLVNIRLEILICIAKLLEFLDKWSVMDDVLAFLPEIRSREPKVLVALLAIYRISFSHKKLGVSLDCLTSKCIPHLLQLSMDLNLTPLQYSAFADLLREMFVAIETEQRAKLVELHSVGEDAAALVSPSLNLDGTASEMVDSIMLILTDVIFSPKHLLSGGNKSAPKSPISDDLAEAFSMDPSKSTQQLSSTSQKQPMSLEAKKRAVTEFEQLERMKQQPNLLTPQAAPTPKTKPLPTDLTDTLINSNLALDWSRSTTQPPTFQPMAPNPAAPMFANFLTPQRQQQPNYFVQNPTIPCFNGSSTFPQRIPNQLPPASTTYGRPQAPANFIQPIPASQASSNNNHNSVNPPALSKSDIMDLLG